MHLVQLLEDSLQMHRLRYVIDGREGDSRDEHVQGMLGEWCRQHHIGKHYTMNSFVFLPTSFQSKSFSSQGIK